MRIGGVKAYVGIVIGSKNRKLDAFLFDFEDLKKLHGKPREKM